MWDTAIFSSVMQLQQAGYVTGEAINGLWILRAKDTEAQETGVVPQSLHRFRKRKCRVSDLSTLFEPAECDMNSPDAPRQCQRLHHHVMTTWHGYSHIESSCIHLLTFCTWRNLVCFMWTSVRDFEFDIINLYTCLNQVLKVNLKGSDGVA
jgi:hypothetical protein